MFISYRRDDVPDAAARIRDGLASRFGPRHVFMDVESLLPGGQFEAGLASALERSDVLLVIIGSRWKELMTSRNASGEPDFVVKEIAGALERNLSVIPVRVGDQGELPPLPRADELPSDIREFVRYQSQDLTYQSMGRDISALTQAIARLRQEEARRKTAAGSTIARRTTLSLLALTVALLLTVSAVQFGVLKGLFSIGDSKMNWLWFFQSFASPDFRSWDVLLFNLGRTLAVALWGVVLAGLISIPLALASAGNLSTSWIAWPIRRLTRLVETTEVAIIGVLLLLAFGINPFTVVIAICVHNTGSLSRLFSETIESADRPIANVRYASATAGQIIYAVLPDVLPQWAAGTAARLSSAVRAVIVLEMVGVGAATNPQGNLGQHLMYLLQTFDLPQLSVALILTVSTLIILDVLTRLVVRLLGP